MTRTATGGYRGVLYAAGLALIGVALGGCALPNSSNPTLRLTSAQISGNSASLSVEIENTSGHNLTLESIDWTLVHGPMPVASGVWEVNEPLASGSRIALSRRVRLDTPSLDPSSRDIELSGLMHFGKNAGIESAAFDASRTSSR